MRVRRAVIGLLGAATLMTTGLAACGHHDDAGSESTRLSWHSSALPTPTGERALVRDATWCAGRWVVVGATADAHGRTRPAVWSSADARAWQTVPLRAGPDFYAAREVLSSVACSRGRLAVLGAKPGGAHGMPRTATWRQRADGTLAWVRAPFTLFGGSESVGVSRLSGGSRGYAVTGTRTSGAAVWLSATGSAFRLYDGASGLANTSHVSTQSLDALSSPDGWLLAGEVTEPSGRLRGIVWTGDRDGPWHGVALPGGSTISTAERLVDTPAGPDVAGLLDEGFGLWALRGGQWTLTGTFGSSDPVGTAASYVSGLADVNGRVAATYSDGARFRLWVAGDVAMPTDVPVSGERTATVAAHDGRLLLLTDDGQDGRAWLASVAPAGG